MQEQLPGPPPFLLEIYDVLFGENPLPGHFLVEDKQELLAEVRNNFIHRWQEAGYDVQDPLDTFDVMPFWIFVGQAVHNKFTLADIALPEETPQQTEDRFRLYLSNQLVTDARAVFNHPVWDDEPEQLWERTQKKLRLVHQPLSVLTREQTSDQDILAQARDKIAHTHLVLARRAYGAFMEEELIFDEETGQRFTLSDPNALLQQVRAHLAAIGADAAVLDEQGKLSSAQVEDGLRAKCQELEIPYMPPHRKQDNPPYPVPSGPQG